MCFLPSNLLLLLLWFAFFSLSDTESEASWMFTEKVLIEEQKR